MSVVQPPSNMLAPVSASGDVLIRRLGVPGDGWRDVYYFVLVQPWRVFYGAFASGYILINCLFATLYWLQPGCIAEPLRGDWLEDFFFSFETLATVGFGVLHPVTLYAHWLVTMEIMFGVLAVPLATGLVILKFARPTARVVFSHNAVVTRYDGVPTLIFRLANLRAAQIFEARINVTLLRREVTLEGRNIRRLISLQTQRDNNPMFILSWSVMHRIDESSPLHGVDWATLRPGDLNITAVMTGLDATTSSTVHARHAYSSTDILLGHMFDDIIFADPSGEMTIDYRRLHDVTADRIP